MTPLATRGCRTPARVKPAEHLYSCKSLKGGGQYYDFVNVFDKNLGTTAYTNMLK
jgi:hypothetical protein